MSGRGAGAAAGLTVAMVLLGSLAAAAEMTTAKPGEVVIEPAPVPITVDGRLDEWSGRGSRWAVLAYDQLHLYLAVEVAGGRPKVDDDQSRDFAGSDRIVLLVSRDPDGEAGTNHLLGEEDFAFVFLPDSRYQRPLKTVYGFGGFEHVGLDLRQVAIAAVNTPGGYTLEVRIPWGCLGVTPHPGQLLGLEVVAFDVNPGSSPRVTTLSGQPLGAGIGRHLLRPAALGG
ncbi:MAG: sugar-binding protein [Betaproteobacteria bacterium]